MTIERRPFRGEADFSALLPLLASQPALSRHLIDLPWRLSSPKMQAGDDACLWLHEDGAVLGFAAWQYYWAVLDYFVLPGPHLFVMRL